MIRMSRVGRKALMFGALQHHNYRYPKGALTTAKLAHHAGLISSTNVLNMLRELAAEGKIVECAIEPSYQCGYTVRAWRMPFYKQIPLPDNTITINGTKYNRDAMEAV